MSVALSAKKEGVSEILIIDREESLGGVLNELIEVGHGFLQEGTTGVEVAEELKEKVLAEKIQVRTDALVLEVKRDKSVKYVSSKEGVLEVKGRS
ncbi:MAG TPA: pyridine nucleotide-disulfide oxidoreductase, partial [Clostridiaceae bacterium]|nr:pyridine nucleotide-disulfide oxidoreductase [Clostridiaceae bacterium]